MQANEKWVSKKRRALFRGSANTIAIQNSTVKRSRFLRSLSMPVSRRLVSAHTLGIDRLRAAVRSVGHPLVGIRHALGHGRSRACALLPGLAGAAAGAEGPEQAADKRKAEGEPHVGEHRGAEGHGDAELGEPEVGGGSHAGVG